MKLWLLRHAAPEVAPGTCYGQLDVPALAPDTLAVARAFDEHTAAQALTQVVSSPLVRCTALAQAWCDLKPGRIWQVDARLAELDFGAWEGRAWAAIEPGAISAWADNFTDARPGASGESVREFMARVGAALHDWHHRGQDTLWVTHAGVMRAATLWSRGVPVPLGAADWPTHAPSYGQWMCMHSSAIANTSASMPESGFMSCTDLPTPRGIQDGLL